jgi:hypothetical protein
MLNIHLNGDIIRCPDFAAIHRQANAVKYQHFICRFNCFEAECKQWQTYCLINQIHQEHCNLCEEYENKKYKDGVEWKMYKCSKMQQNYLNAIKPKSYKIDNSIYRKIASSSHFLVKEANNRVLFLTLTFPKFKKKVTEYEINQSFSKFVENLRENYNCDGYIAVRERGTIGNRIHFHILLSLPFISFVKLNASWCSAISSICFFSRNAVTSDPKTRFIKNPTRAMRYVCKYFSKCKNQKSKTRLVFISNNVLSHPKQMTHDPEHGLLDRFKFDYMKQTSDFTTCYRITDWKNFSDFCDEFLYPFFELSIKKPNFIPSPLNSS